MPQYLYRVGPARAEFYEAPTPEEIHAVDKHFFYLKRWAEEGTVLLAGRTQNEDLTGFGIVIFEASGEREGRRFMQEDPAVRAGVFEAELLPYNVALRSSRWGAASSESKVPRTRCRRCRSGTGSGRSSPRAPHRRRSGSR